VITVVDLRAFCRASVFVQTLFITLATASARSRPSDLAGAYPYILLIPVPIIFLHPSPSKSAGGEPEQHNSPVGLTEAFSDEAAGKLCRKSLLR